MKSGVYYLTKLNNS